MDDVVVMSDFFCTSNKGEFNKLIDIIEKVKESGYLKDHVGCAGSIIHYNYRWLFDVTSSGATSQLSKILEIPSTKPGKKLLTRYIETFFPISLTDSHQIKIAKKKPRGREGYEDALISFEDFRILHNKCKLLTIDQIRQIRDEILGQPPRKEWRIELGRHLRWPSTEAPQSLKKLFSDGWVTTGILAHFGYHVGRLSQEESERKLCLESILSSSIEKSSDFLCADYVEKWGQPNSMKRLMTLAKTIAALCRNAKRSSNNCEEAISDWESDLSFLREKYYSNIIGDAIDEWPKTNLF